MFATEACRHAPPKDQRMPCSLKPSILQHGFLVKATRHYSLPDMTLLSGLMCKASILAWQIALFQSHEHTPLAYKICKTSQDSILHHCECNILWSGRKPSRSSSFSVMMFVFGVSKIVRSHKFGEYLSMVVLSCFWISAQTGQKQQAATRYCTLGTQDLPGVRPCNLLMLEGWNVRHRTGLLLKTPILVHCAIEFQTFFQRCCRTSVTNQWPLGPCVKRGGTKGNEQRLMQRAWHNILQSIKFFDKVNESSPFCGQVRESCRRMILDKNTPVLS